MELNKSNRQIYALTFGPKTIPPMNHKNSRKRMRLDYKQYKLSLLENCDMLLQSMKVGEQCSTVSDIMASPLAK